MRNQRIFQPLTHEPMSGRAGIALQTGIVLLFFCGGCATTLRDVEKSNDQVFLARVAKNDKDRKVCEAAVEKLTDQSLLADVAKKDVLYSSVRVVAVGKLTDQSLLADFAKNGKDEYIRITAVKKLIDKALLKEIAENDEMSERRINPRARSLYSLPAGSSYRKDVYQVPFGESLHVTIWPVRDAARKRLAELEIIGR